MVHGDGFEDIPIVDAHSDVEYHFIQNERLAILNTCINQLSIIEKTLITLYLEDMKYSEIAEIMGISEKSVGVRLVRIKRKMNSMLK
jgi:RNA polymerase sigma-70 factor (ECF subfamily)